MLKESNEALRGLIERQEREMCEKEEIWRL
jgi:hypothetical protein